MQQVEPIVFDTIQHRCNEDLWVPETQSLCFADDEIDFIADFEQRCIVGEMFLSRFELPSRPFGQSAYELVLACHQIYHPTLRVRNQCDGRNSADRDRIGDFELTRPQVRASSADDEGEVVGNPKVFPVVHAHSDQELGLCV